MTRTSAEKLSVWYRLDAAIRRSTLFSFEGRINRKTYWLKGVLPLVVFFFALQLVVGAMPKTTLGLILWYGLALAWVGMFLAVASKRLHDRNKSMWWLLVWFVPVVGWLILFIELGFAEGTPVANRYGNPQVPNPTKGWARQDRG